MTSLLGLFRVLKYWEDQTTPSHGIMGLVSMLIEEDVFIRRPRVCVSGSASLRLLTRG